MMKKIQNYLLVNMNLGLHVSLTSLLIRIMPEIVKSVVFANATGACMAPTSTLAMNGSTIDEYCPGFHVNSKPGP